MKRREFLKSLAWVTLAATVPAVAAKDNEPAPNVIDLDQLHDQSLRLADYHVSPMCAPTRGQLLTGLDAARNGAINVSSGRALLRPEIPTIANLFGESGYATGLFGKWHLGANYPFRPQGQYRTLGGTTILTTPISTTAHQRLSKATARMSSSKKPWLS
jgi:arylsulfatase A-like enzyme